MHIGSTPKYEKIEENNVNVEEENNYFIEKDLNENLHLNQNNENDFGSYRKERKIKISTLPDGGKQVEITEKT